MGHDCWCWCLPLHDSSNPGTFALRPLPGLKSLLLLLLLPLLLPLLLLLQVQSWHP